MIAPPQPDDDFLTHEELREILARAVREFPGGRERAALAGGYEVRTLDSMTGKEGSGLRGAVKLLVLLDRLGVSVTIGPKSRCARCGTQLRCPSCTH